MNGVAGRIGKRRQRRNGVADKRMGEHCDRQWRRRQTRRGQPLSIRPGLNDNVFAPGVALAGGGRWC
jgi:hypothetical protein